VVLYTVNYVSFARMKFIPQTSVVVPVKLKQMFPLAFEYAFMTISPTQIRIWWQVKLGLFSSTGHLQYV